MQHRHVTFDDQPSIVTEPSPLAKRRGRPRGSKTRTWLGSAQSFTTADFSFLRAHLLGMEVRQAASRYLLHLDISTTRDATAYFKALLFRIRSLDEKQLDIEDENVKSVVVDAVVNLSSWLSDVDSWESKNEAPPVSQPLNAVCLPTLEEFIEAENLGDFGVEEAQYLYEEKYAEQLGAPSSSPQVIESANNVLADPFSNKRLVAVVDAISKIQAHITVSPNGVDLTKAWFPPALAELFLPFGVLSVSDLVNWINISGRGWHKNIKNIGKSRAHRLMMWLIDNEKTIGTFLAEDLKSSLLGSSNSSVAVESGGSALTEWQALEYGIVPLTNFDWPLMLKGGDGLFRSSEPNTYMASNDAEAIGLWLSEYKNKSPRTFEAYSRFVEWLVLWSVVEQRKSISSLTRPDLLEFKEFLLSPPAHWIQTARVTKESKLWRPLRGPLSASSVESAMRAISALFSALRESNYLTANVAKGLVSTRRDDIKLDTTKSLSNQDVEVVGATIHSMPDSARKNRFRALLLLLQTTGLRRSELVQLKWSDLKRARTDNNESDVWQVSFLGKGMKARTLPITIQTYQALLAHRDDRIKLTKARKLAYLAYLELGDWPLIGILDEAQAQERSGKPSDFVFDAPRAANTSGALSVQRLHAVIKSFFQECIKKAHELGRDSTNFEKSSLHWLRHTFAHQVIAATGDLAVTQQLLGHSSIAVTGLYIKADMKQRIDAVQKVKLQY